jgi:hypothetical protein
MNLLRTRQRDHRFGVLRTWRACSDVVRALCRFKVFLCRVRAALDPAPAPVLGMAAAEAAPGGGLLCAGAGGGASVRMKAKPSEAKIALRMVMSSLSTQDDSYSLIPYPTPEPGRAALGSCAPSWEFDYIVPKNSDI